MAAVLAAPDKSADPLVEAELAAKAPRPMNQVMVDLAPRVGADAFAALHNLTIVRPMHSWDNGWVMRGGTPASIAALVPVLLRQATVEYAEQDMRLFMERFQFAPNDPYYPVNSPAGHPGQWHLRNTANQGNANIDTRVWPVWQANITGTGVVIGIVDDAVQIGHPDLSPNVSAADSFDFGQNDNDPTPVWNSDNHGTSVAGVAAARGGNGIGGTGAAPLAQIAGLRIDFQNQTTSQFVDATNYRSLSPTNTIAIKNHSYGFTVPYVVSPSRAAALAQTGNGGTIHVVAAGNSRGGLVDDANKNSLQNSVHSITVAALAQDGVFSNYSSFGANVFVTAPSSDDVWNPILTTDRTGAAGYNAGGQFPDANYAYFGGTSSASPLVAGVLALVKQFRPNLDRRFAKHLLAISSDVVNAGDATAESDGGWKTNAAGRQFNQNYGFGLINADRLIANATLFQGVSPETVDTFPAAGIAAPIPDNDSNGITRNITNSMAGTLEEVELNINISHLFRGDIEVYLTSPSGTTGRMVRRNAGDSGDNIDWWYTSNLFWGETASGSWTVRVADVSAGTTGTWNSASLRLHTGSLVSAATIASVSVNPSVVGGGLNSTGTVTLTAPAGPGGVTVNLSSSMAVASVPATVDVPAGATMANFVVTTFPTASDTVSIITATRLSSTASTAITVERMKMQAVTLNPSTVKMGSPSTGTVTLNSPAPVGGQVVTLTSNRPSVVVPASVTVPAGAQSTNFNVTTSTVSAQVQATIVGATNSTSRFGVLTVDPPYVSSVLLNPGILAGGASSSGRVNLDAPAPAGGYVVTVSSNRTAVTVPATVTVPAGATLVNFPVTTVPVPLFTQATITAAVAGRSRFGVLNVTPPPLTSHSITPSAVLGGVSATGTVTIASAAPSPGVVVTIISNRAAVQAPATVTIPTGQTSTTYTLTTSQITAPVAATVYAQFYDRSRFATLTVNPPALVSHTAAPSTLVGGNPSVGTLTLDNPAPPGGMTATITSNRAQVQVPATVTIPAGATSVNYNITTSPVTAQVQATLVANINGRTRFVVVTVNRP
jgi:subtilisin-like proprotein convertase family protein